MQHLTDICRQLAAEGKEPAVGLVKARAGKSARLPDIIQAIQQWRKLPPSVKEKQDDICAASPPSPETGAPEQHVASNNKHQVQILENRIAILEKQVVQMQQQINALQSRQYKNSAD